MEERVAAVLDLLDLTPLRNRPIRTLSGGERQRVANWNSTGAASFRIGVG